jgi:ABC-2 type transport system permease protein
MTTISTTISATTRWQTVRRALASEVIKLGTVQSSVWLLVAATAFTLFLGPVQALGEVITGPSDEVTRAADSGPMALSIALTGTTTAALIVGVLGVLLVTGEYVPRSIRTTFMLVPRRAHVVIAKLLAGGLVVAATGVVAVAIAVTVSLALLSQADMDVTWGSPQVLRISAATVWYLVGWLVLGQTAGWLTRSKLGGSALLLVAMLVLTPVLGLIPGRTGEIIVGLMPAAAGAAMVGPDRAGGLGEPLVGFALWTAYVAACIPLSAWLAAKRDA